MEGEKVLLEATLSKPDYPVKWMKDGKPLTANDRVRLIVDGCVHRLEIDSADIDDEATYSLQASDKTCKGLVLVEGLLY